MTDTPKFTPGPWEWEEGYSDDGGKYQLLTSRANDGYEDVINGEYGCIVNDADANLIKAAPDLYEAVAALFEYAKKHPNAVVCDMIAYGEVGLKLLLAKRKADGQS